ncbi:hypothetical protein E2C01_019253 [Portunus trituberculatus]|uniref:Uncharacterized protein n=1 Tax=Portunus trituberculatus TaxID=210409 RepID=A0A5B7DWS1_PORTR|nr:hypothetical protein [Portunus trituberculatus]
MATPNPVSESPSGEGTRNVPRPGRAKDSRRSAPQSSLMVTVSVEPERCVSQAVLPSTLCLFTVGSTLPFTIESISSCGWEGVEGCG